MPETITSKIQSVMFVLSPVSGVLSFTDVFGTTGLFRSFGLFGSLGTTGVSLAFTVKHFHVFDCIFLPKQKMYCDLYVRFSLLLVY